MNDQRLRRLGDSRARSELAARYLPLARSLALRYRFTHEPIEDLVQVASLGLVKAINRWDPDRGTPFASYAARRSSASFAGISGTTRGWSGRRGRCRSSCCSSCVRARLWSAQGREPTVSELATALDRRPQLIMEAIAAADGRHAVSLDAPTAGDGESSTYLGLLGGADADAALAAVDDRLLADHLVRSLDSRARAVLRMRFELDLRQWEIADRVGISQMHVSRILRDALATLHRHATGIPSGAPRAAPA